MLRCWCCGAGAGAALLLLPVQPPQTRVLVVVAAAATATSPHRQAYLRALADRELRAELRCPPLRRAVSG